MAGANSVLISRSLQQLMLQRYLESPTRSFSSKDTDKVNESPRLREFRKKLRERAPIEKLEELEEGKHPYQEKEPLKSFPDNTNPETGEIGGPRGTLMLKMQQDINASAEGKREESPRMKQFHEKLKLQPIPKVGPRERFVDLVLVEIDSNTGELIADSEKEPTKWGDWQHGGRVTDF